jgi:glycosyltransferase involved in cell wall biosynthesis
MDCGDGMVRVCIMTTVHHAFDQRIFHKQAKSLVRAGYEVTLVVPHERDEFKDGVRIKAVPQSTGRIARMTRTMWQVYREAVRLNADVYHFHDPELIPIGLLLRMKGKRVIYDVHEYYMEKIQSKHYIPSFLRSPMAGTFDFFESFASRFFDGIIVTDRVTEAKFHGKAVRVGNYPYLPENLNGGKRYNDFFTIVYVGVLSEDRGLFSMIKAMEFVQAPVRLLLIGKFASDADKRKAIAIAGYEKVTWLGWKPWPEAMKIVASCHMGLLLLQPVSAYLYAGENTVKLFEYMMFGLPIIASDFPNLVDIIKTEGCGVVVDPQDVKAIAENIGYFFNHPQEAEAMGRHGCEAVENHYNWGNEEGKLLQLYSELTDSGCPV